MTLLVKKKQEKFYLKNKLASKLDVETSNLILGNGSNEIIEFVSHALLRPEDEIVVSQYCFAIYPLIAMMMGAKVSVVPAVDYGHDLPAMLEALSDSLGAGLGLQQAMMAEADRNNGTLSGTLLLQLSANDKITIHRRNGEGGSDNVYLAHSAFMGYLVG